MPRVWKIAPGEKAEDWPVFRRKGCIGLGWTDIGDLRKYASVDAIRAKWKELELDQKDGHGKPSATALITFVRQVEKGDIIIANNGLSAVVGIGKIESDFIPPRSKQNPIPKDETHRRNVRRIKWIIDQEVDVPKNLFTRNTLYELKPDKVEKIKKAYWEKYPQLRPKLVELFGNVNNDENNGGNRSESNSMKALLKQFGQIILYGPPGTVKTREAKRVALALLSGKDAESDSTADEIEEGLNRFRAENRFEFVVFHPAYEYERFVGGIEPTESGGQVVFETKGGVFLRLCREAEKHNKPTVFVIDEINRGNLPKLLGELVYALEYRDHHVRLPFEWPKGDSSLIIPKNLFIIATMNSADRSIGHIDVAIRRRFGLCHFGLDASVVRREWSRDGRESGFGDRLARLMDQLNTRLSNGGSSSLFEAELGVGHSYFIPSPEATTAKAAMKEVQCKWQYQVQPLLQEYAQLLNQPDSFKQYLNVSLDETLNLADT